MANYTITQVDYSGENTTTTFLVSDADDGTGQDALDSALRGVSMGNVWKESFSVVQRSARTLPTDIDAQRERKILLQCEDSVNFKQTSITIGCADVSAVTIPSGTDLITLDDGGVMATLVTAVQAHALSNSGNPLTVISARLVGRNT